MQKIFKSNSISLDIGAGGAASWEFFKDLRKILNFTGKWTNTGDDGAVFDLTPLLSLRRASRRRSNPALIQNKHEIATPRFGGIRNDKQQLVMTTDAFIIDPIFFPGGDIGKISMCGTINDLSVMGAKPLGIALSFIIEEGFPTSDLEKIVRSINEISRQTNTPIVTGDTKVSNRGKIDKIAITTCGIGIAEKIISNNGARPGDKVISSGDLGEHGAIILAHRFNYKTLLKSDSQPILKEIQAVGKYLTSAKDPTRGGLAENLNEIAEKSKVKIVLDEKNLPYKKEVKSIGNLLGIDIMALPSEGRFIVTAPTKFASKVIRTLRKYNKTAKIIGEVQKGKGVFLNTESGGLRPIEMPRGKLVPRIC
ncbi:hydrogenase expression/formation protein HypE [Patescibacteria group bacterium]|nr:hydrogenase expression/formation protein HypE [Patescibacteria group bacterium]MBU4000100.1 hydrogenase expression/formation protein HypE [Patescibacteria group bacterium]MBU4056775.1 hydrogenase expression/formation protein HypE [Patescibacteria group bacterium]MBU4368182.1 hydrogenase expression/formation protein HypE [Patescibacteria group bacterium]